MVALTVWGGRRVPGGTQRAGENSIVRSCDHATMGLRSISVVRRVCAARTDLLDKKGRCSTLALYSGRSRRAQKNRACDRRPCISNYARHAVWTPFASNVHWCTPRSVFRGFGNAFQPRAARVQYLVQRMCNTQALTITARCVGARRRPLPSNARAGVARDRTLAAAAAADRPVASSRAP